MPPRSPVFGHRMWAVRIKRRKILKEKNWKELEGKVLLCTDTLVTPWAIACLAPTVLDLLLTERRSSSFGSGHTDYHSFVEYQTFKPHSTQAHDAAYDILQDTGNFMCSYITIPFLLVLEDPMEHDSQPHRWGSVAARKTAVALLKQSIPYVLLVVDVPWNSDICLRLLSVLIIVSGFQWRGMY